jgi:hypothetical protein
MCRRCGFRVTVGTVCPATKNYDEPNKRNEG